MVTLYLNLAGSFREATHCGNQSVIDRVPASNASMNPLNANFTAIEGHCHCASFLLISNG